MNKSLQLTLCDTQGKLFELSGERGYDSEAFIKAFMTTDISKDMDKDFHQDGFTPTKSFKQLTGHLN